MDLLKLANLVALIAAVAWFARMPDWGSGILAFTLFATQIGFELQDRWSKPKVHDVELFAKLQDTLPQIEVMEFFRHHDFGGSFPTEYLKPLWDFAETWDNVEHEFLDRRLNRLRTELLSVVRQFNALTGQHTFARNQISSVPKEWRDTRPEKYHSIVRQINKQADIVYQAHQKLIRKARKRLVLRAT